MQQTAAENSFVTLITFMRLVFFPEEETNISHTIIRKETVDGESFSNCHFLLEGIELEHSNRKMSLYYHGSNQCKMEN